ncbi:hypothetical protein ACTHGU_15290 [Chitinophagaceae bacterium MMS25-I14]
MLLCISYQCVVKLGIIAWYEWNKNYVATVLCENKDKPQMHCCGKCYLRKQLNKADDGTEKNQGKNNTVKWEKIEQAPFLVPENYSVPFYAVSTTSHFTSRYLAPSGYDPLISVFHPPSVSC